MRNWSEVPVGRRTGPADKPSDRPSDKPSDTGADERRPPSFAPRKPRRSMDDLVVPDAVRDRIELALAQLDHHDVLYREWNLRKIDPYRSGAALNFYGPPGTGKSLAAEAIAERRGSPLIDVNYAEIESKYVGDTPKNIVACFREAERRQAVLVFNEADSILGSRLSNVTQSSDHSVNVSRAVMLSQLDDFAGLVVFTTNFPRNYDAAFVRRILVHVRFDLPDEPTRRRLWASLVPAEVPRAEPLDLTALAASSDGLSGGDMVNAVKAAATRAVTRSGEDRVLRTEDLLAEIDAVVLARADVGKAPSEPPRVVAAERVGLDAVPEAS
ncbi:ATPase family protein associated with various cellular activities (AAA) [Actinomadura pelletieri DSM 43383]|uniref:ATPase family protein associated with various cellular activities (AAA) n=1 Tax=Actinomadura pelletieri DSM 43383 TaxID=1120940 RepID=A0A495QN08_9ACTN|nr:ATP-binding protein [Actinomadura pelletieri]RKS74316.1 ATPase family protein associated with various cellular activities (AAA) [Actinomadura pelletieri DSM 43383]